MNRNNTPEEQAKFMFSFAGAIVGIIFALVVIGIFELIGWVSITFKTINP